MIGHEEATERRLGVAEDHVAPAAAIHEVPGALEGADGLAPGHDREPRHLQLHDLLGDRRRDRIAVLLEALEVRGHRLADVRDGLLPRAPLRDAAGQRGRLGHPGAVVVQLEEGRHDVENAYARAVRADGNPTAVDLIRQVFRVTNRKWRGIGEIPLSGLALSEAYASFDAETRFAVDDLLVEESPDCVSGLILQGLLKPPECAAFGTRCTPEHPMGATMVSSEGACAAYYRYRASRLVESSPIPPST